MKAAEAVGEKYKDAIPQEKLARVRDEIKKRNFGGAAEILKQARDKGEINDLRDAGLSNAEIKKIGGGALQIHPDLFKPMRDAFPFFAKEISEGFSKEIQKAAGVAFTDDKEAKKYDNNIGKKILANLSPAKIENVDLDSLTSGKGLGTLIEHGSAAQIMAAGRKHGKKYVDAFNEFVDDYGHKKFRDINPATFNRLSSTPGQALGFSTEIKEKEEPKIKIVGEYEDISKYKK